MEYFKHLTTYRAAGASLLAVCLGGGSALASHAPVAPFSLNPSVRLLADNKKAQQEEEPKGDPIDVAKLPKALVDAVKKAYPGIKITKAAKLEDGNYFLDDVKVGKKTLDLIVTPKGKVVKETEMKEGD